MCSSGAPSVLDATLGVPVWPGMFSGPVAELRPQPHLGYCVYQAGGCVEKPNCPALLSSPWDERGATNSFAELLRYLISSNCSWEDRGKEQDSSVDRGKGKRMVEMGRKEGLGGMDGNPWRHTGRRRENGEASREMMDADNKKREKPDKQRTEGRNKGKEGKTKRAACCQALWSSQDRRLGGYKSGSWTGPILALQSWDVLEIEGTTAASSWDDTTNLEVVESLAHPANEEYLQSR